MERSRPFTIGLTHTSAASTQSSWLRTSSQKSSLYTAHSTATPRSESALEMEAKRVKAGVAVSLVWRSPEKTIATRPGLLDDIGKLHSSVRSEPGLADRYGGETSIHGIPSRTARRQRLDARRAGHLERTGSLPYPRYEAKIIRRADLERQRTRSRTRPITFSFGITETAPTACRDCPMVSAVAGWPLDRVDEYLARRDGALVMRAGAAAISSGCVLSVRWHYSRDGRRAPLVGREIASLRTCSVDL